MSDEELIVWQAKKIATLLTSLDYWIDRYYESEAKNAPSEKPPEDRFTDKENDDDII